MHKLFICISNYMCARVIKQSWYVYLTKQRDTQAKLQMKEELWNNSWVKNLPVRPLAPRGKTPGQLNPSIQDLPGLGQNKEKKRQGLNHN